jgi:hypothetical protein
MYEDVLNMSGHMQTDVLRMKVGNVILGEECEM